MLRADEGMPSPSLSSSVSSSVAFDLEDYGLNAALNRETGHPRDPAHHGKPDLRVLVLLARRRLCQGAQSIRGVSGERIGKLNIEPLAALGKPANAINQLLSAASAAPLAVSAYCSAVIIPRRVHTAPNRPISSTIHNLLHLARLKK